MFEQIIRDTAANFEFNNTTLLLNQLGVETDIRNNVETGTGFAKLGNGIDGCNDLPYWNPDGNIKVYRALWEVGDPPTVATLENSLSAAIVWTKSGGGDYLGTLIGAFTANKTFALVTLGTGGGADAMSVACARASADTVELVFYDNAGSPVDPTTTPVSIEILVYPA